ncbi:MAG: signal peptidase II [Turicibacter sp.]|nr:signal peptidase II [Turicibacter sp.]
MVIATLIVIGILVLDQVTKHLVVYHMDLGQSIEVFPNLLYITSHRNAGAAWGILYGQMVFFYIVTVIVVAILIIWMRKLSWKNDRLMMWSLTLLLGGALGNFIDRVLFQQVVDFVDTFPFGYNFPIFNVADMALTFGVALMGLDALLEAKRGK